jgi:hypothetical protein
MLEWEDTNQNFIIMLHHFLKPDLVPERIGPGKNNCNK